MITIDQLRDAVIAYEQAFIFDMYEDEGKDPQPHIEEMVNDLAECDCVDDIADYYDKKGYDGYGAIISVLMAKSTIVSSNE